MCIGQYWSMVVDFRVGNGQFRRLRKQKSKSGPTFRDNRIMFVTFKNSQRELFSPWYHSGCHRFRHIKKKDRRTSPIFVPYALNDSREYALTIKIRARVEILRFMTFYPSTMRHLIFRSNSCKTSEFLLARCFVQTLAEKKRE